MTEKNAPCGITLEKNEIERIIFGFASSAQKQITDNLQKPKKRVIILSGPTGSGKTELSIMLAKAINGEIISADSMQVYKGMDIGTAKAENSERDGIPHHLIDIRHVGDVFNVVDFYYEARQCCRKILDRGAVPIIVGGSGFYLHSLIYGPPSGPPSVPEVRKSLEDELERLGPECLYDRLRQLDRVYANSITKHDKQKIIRALEIIALTGKKVSQLEWKNRQKPQNYDFRCWFLQRPKEKLYERINQRCERMLANGFLEEVETLNQGGIRNNPSAAQAIGYRQALEYLDSDQSDADYKKFVSRFKMVSRNYAKRQFTWFRKENLFHWLDLDLHDPEIAVDMIRQDFEAGL